MAARGPMMARNKPPAFQFYPDAWLSSADISLMTPAEEGGFIRLLCHAWLEPDCGLPDDDKILAKLSRLNRTWNRVSGHKLRAKFRSENGRLYNDRLLEERRKQLKWKEKSSTGGKKSAAARGKGGCQMVDEWLQPNVNSASSVFNLHKTNPNPSLNPPQTNEAKNGPASQPSSNSENYFQTEFDRLAERYPGHVDRDHAFRTWMSLFDSGGLAAKQVPEVAAGLDRWLASAQWAEQDGKFIPSLSNWLNGSKGRRWLDKPKPREAAGEEPDWRPPWEDEQGNTMPEFEDDRGYTAEEIAEVERSVGGGAA